VELQGQRRAGSPAGQSRPGERRHRGLVLPLQQAARTAPPARANGAAAREAASKRLCEGHMVAALPQSWASSIRHWRSGNRIEARRIGAPSGRMQLDPPASAGPLGSSKIEAGPPAIPRPTLLIRVGPGGCPAPHPNSRCRQRQHPAPIKLPSSHAEPSSSRRAAMAGPEANGIRPAAAGRRCWAAICANFESTRSVGRRDRAGGCRPAGRKGKPASICCASFGPRLPPSRAAVGGGRGGKRPMGLGREKSSHR